VIPASRGPQGSGCGQRESLERIRDELVIVLERLRELTGSSAAPGPVPLRCEVDPYPGIRDHLRLALIQLRQAAMEAPPGCLCATARGPGTACLCPAAASGAGVETIGMRCRYG